MKPDGTDENEARVALDRSLNFLWENFDDLQRAHRGRYIAIHHGKLIAVEDNYLDACEAIKAQGVMEQEVLVWYIPVAGIA